MRLFLSVLAIAVPLSQAVITLAASTRAVMAQEAGGTSLSFGGLRGDPNLPVTVTSQTLTMDETLNRAVFSGAVLVVQGDMRLSADEVRVQYDETASKIQRLFAQGNVILVNASDAAQSQSAEYAIDDGIVTMQGDVVLTQGPATFSASRLVVDLKTGLGRLEGGVRSTFTPNALQKTAP